MNKKLYSIIGAIVLALVIFAFFSCSKEEKQEEKEQEIIVKVATMQIGSDQSRTAKLEKSVLFNSKQAAEVITEYTGRIKEVNFEVGDQVKKDQILAKFDQSYDTNTHRIRLDYAAKNLNIAKDNYEKTLEIAEEKLEVAKDGRKLAEVQLENAKDNYDDDKTEENKQAVKVAKRNLKTAEDLEDIAEEEEQTLINSAQLSVNEASQGINEARIGYNTTIIKAPIAGQVVSKNVQVDDYKNSGLVVAQIVGEGKLEAVFSLSRTQAQRIYQGASVELEVGGEVFAGEVASLSSVASGDNSRFEAKVVSLENLASKANQTGKVKIDLMVDGLYTDSYFLPLEAVNIGQRKTEVFVVEQGIAHARQVEIGELVGTQVEIVSGLMPNDEVVIENARNLREGDRVEVKEELEA